MVNFYDCPPPLEIQPPVSGLLPVPLYMRYLNEQSGPNICRLKLPPLSVYKTHITEAAIIENEKPVAASALAAAAAARPGVEQSPFHSVHSIRPSVSIFPLHFVVYIHTHTHTWELYLLRKKGVLSIEL